MDDTIPEGALALDQQLCFAVYATAHAFTRAYKPLLDALGLTYPQYIVMLALWERGDVPVKAIGEALYLDTGTLSPLLKRLEQAGLIRRVRDKKDERQVIVGLTESGTAMKAEAEKVLIAIGKASGCSLSEMAALRESLHKLRTNLVNSA